jgi:RNA polymerase primary sigma factor
MNSQRPLNTIDLVNRLVRTSRQMMQQIHREPTPEELAHKLAIPVEEVHELWEIARTPVRLNP